MPIQSHIKWMLLAAAKSIPQIMNTIPQIMNNQSEEDTATKEALSLNQCLLSTGRGHSDLSMDEHYFSSAGKRCISEEDLSCHLVGHSEFERNSSSSTFLFNEPTINYIK